MKTILRNSEGDFLTLRDGRLVFVYSHFTGGKSDDATAYLAGRFSEDGGCTWSEGDAIILANEGKQNVMSVTLRRLPSDEIALFYLAKHSRSHCLPMVRFSDDEMRSWSDPRTLVDVPGYYVLNNDRVTQLQSGRLVAPLSHHGLPDEDDFGSRVLCYYSDDNARTWQRSRSVLTCDAQGEPVGPQEPGLIELRDGRLMMFARTRLGCQYVAYSSDRGDTFTTLAPSNIRSPLSPASIKRIPATGDLIMLWNDQFDPDQPMAGPRTPFNVAVSEDDGNTWVHKKTLADDPDGWYCYTAIKFIDDRILLGHCAGNRAEKTGLSRTQITEISLDWLYDRK